MTEKISTDSQGGDWGSLSGDALALSMLYERFRRPIHSYIYHMLGNQEDADDITQEVFVRACIAWQGLRDRDNLSAWLYRIATNTARSHLRHERVIRWLPWRDYEEDSGSDLLSVAGPEEHAGEAECVRQVLGCLPSQYQVCLLLQLVGGFSQREIAELLEISEKSVSAYVSRGREQFRQLYLRTKGESR